MSKKMLSAFSAGAATLSLLMAEGVQADQVVEETAAGGIAVNAEETASQAPVTQEQVTEAQTVLNQANTALAQAQQEEAAARSAAENSQTVLNQATSDYNQAQATAQQARPENVEQARADLREKESAASSAAASQEQSKAAADQAQSKAADQAQRTSEAQNRLADQEANRNQAQQAVDTAKANLSGENEARAREAVSQAEEKVALDRAALSDAQDAVNRAQQADSVRQRAVEEATAQKNQAETAANTAQTNLGEKTAAANRTQAALEAAQTALQNAQNSPAARPATQNRVTMTAEYIDALKQFVDPANAGQLAQIEERLKAENARAKALNTYVADPNDSTALIDTNNIPENVRQELTQFASDLLNQLRQQMGTGATVVTASSLDFADRVSREYRNDNWSWDLMNRYHHDAAGINRAARAYGLPTTTAAQEQLGQQYYENAMIWREVRPQLSVADMKRRIYTAIVEFLYNGYEWDHARSITGLNTGSQTNYLGVDFSTESDITMAHFTMVADDQIRSASMNNFSTTPLAAPASADPQAVAQAQNAYDAALAANNQAQSERSAAETAYNQARAALDTASQALDRAVSAAEALPQAQSALAAANQQLQEDLAALAQAQSALNSATSSQADREAALTRAEAALAAAETSLAAARDAATAEMTALEEANQELSAAQAALAERQAALEAAQSAVAAARQSLEKLENAEDNLAAAKNRLDAAQADYDTKQAALTEAEDALAILALVQALAQGNFDALSARYQSQQFGSILDETERNLRAQQTSADPGQRGRGGQGAVAVRSGNRPQSLQKGQTGLPRTGSSSSVWSLMGGFFLMLSGLALSLWRRRLEARD